MYKQWRNTMQFFVDHGIDNAFYWGCYVLAFTVTFVFNAKYAKKYNISAFKGLAFSFASYAIIYIWAYILGWVANGFSWGHHNAIRVFAWMPLVLLVVGKLFKIKWNIACDYIAPSTCLVYGIARLGCNFTGCCYGYPACWGIYSWQAGHRCFPVQLCQSIASIAVFFIILHLAKTRDYKPTNKLYPIMLIMYGAARFLLEFFMDNKKLFMHVSEIALWGLLCVIIGFVWLYGSKKEEMINSK